MYKKDGAAITVTTVNLQLVNLDLSTYTKTQKAAVLQFKSIAMVANGLF